MANIKRSIVKRSDVKTAVANSSERCLKAALGMLSYRPRSEKEIRVNLGRRFEIQVIDNTLIQLRKMKLVDDAAFAEYWREKRETYSPRSRSLIGAELRQKGVGRELAANVISNIDDDECAYRAAHKKASALASEDYAIFRRKLSAFLYRKGFSYDVSAHAVSRLWQEFR